MDARFSPQSTQRKAFNADRAEKSGECTTEDAKSWKSEWNCFGKNQFKSIQVSGIRHQVSGVRDQGLRVLRGDTGVVLGKNNAEQPRRGAAEGKARIRLLRC